MEGMGIMGVVGWRVKGAAKKILQIFGEKFGGFKKSP